MNEQKLIIFCDPKYPIQFFESFLYRTKPYFNVRITTYIHSSLQHFSNSLLTFYSEYKNSNEDVQVDLTIIWKEIGIDPVMKLPGIHNILGEINIARYLNRLVETCYPYLMQYETNGALYANEIDSCLEKIHCILHGNMRGCRVERQHDKERVTSEEGLSIADIILASRKGFQLPTK